MHGHTRTAEDRIIAEDVGVADDKAPRPAQIAERRRELPAGLAQIDFEQPAFERNDVTRGLRQGIEDLASEFRRDAVPKVPLEGERHESPRIKKIVST